MRDHQRRTEIRLIVLKESAERIAALANEGASPSPHPEVASLRLAVVLEIGRFAYFCQLPKEFRDVNPEIPWERLRRLRTRATFSSAIEGRNPRSIATLWRIATVEVPRIARQLNESRMPLIWKNEPHGNLGIAEVLGPHLEEIRQLRRRHRVGTLRIYGSVARGEADGRSDVDLLIDWAAAEPWGGSARISRELEAILGRRVQVYPGDRIYWAIRDRVLSEAREVV